MCTAIVRKYWMRRCATQIKFGFEAEKRHRVVDKVRYSARLRRIRWENGSIPEELSECNWTERTIIVSIMSQWHSIHLKQIRNKWREGERERKRVNVLLAIHWSTLTIKECQTVNFFSYREPNKKRARRKIWIPCQVKIVLLIKLRNFDWHHVRCKPCAYIHTAWEYTFHIIENVKIFESLSRFFRKWTNLFSIVAMIAFYFFIIKCESKIFRIFQWIFASIFRP